MSVYNGNFFILFGIALFFSQQVNADQDLEKRYLAKIHHELSALAPFLKKASDNAVKASRYYFDHDKLALTLKQIMLEIEKHMNTGQRMPYQAAKDQLDPVSTNETERKSASKLGAPVPIDTKVQ